MKQKETSKILLNARRLVRWRRAEEAERAYSDYLKLVPDSIEATIFIANRYAWRGEFRKAEDILSRAARLNPRNVRLLTLYGIVLLQVGRLEMAQDVLETTLRFEPSSYVIRLHLGEVFERVGNRKAALFVYFKAIFLAQSAGEWLSDASTPAAYRTRVKRAMAFVDHERKILFSEITENIKKEFGSRDMGRMERTIKGYLDHASNYTDDRQRPTFLYIPNLSNTPFFKDSLFPWFGFLEANYRKIREEFLVLLEKTDSFTPVHDHLDKKRQYDLVAAGEGGSWDALFFYRHGERIEENCNRCPLTAAILEELPLVRIRDHAPEVLFSVLRPGAHIKPHRGVSNLRSVVHLPLVVPGNCALHLTGEAPYAWQEGKCIAFDDTFEHEAWNRSGTLRAILLLDTWNPYLEEFERVTLTRFVEAVGDFKRDWNAA